MLDLRDVTLVCQDWGGLLGLRLVGEHPDRFARVVAANTGLPTGDQPMSEAFLAWQRFAATAERFDVGRIVSNGTSTDLAPEVVAAYDAPFPDDSYKAGARVFPSLVPTTPDDPASAANRAAWETLARFDSPFFTAFSDSDPITGGGDRVFHKLVPGARGLDHVTLAGGGALSAGGRRPGPRPRRRRPDRRHSRVLIPSSLLIACIADRRHHRRTWLGQPAGPRSPAKSSSHD